MIPLKEPYENPHFWRAFAAACLGEQARAAARRGRGAAERVAKGWLGVLARRGRGRSLKGGPYRAL